MYYLFAAFEFLDNGAVYSVEKNLKVRNPLDSYPFYVLIETSGSNATHDEEVSGTDFNLTEGRGKRVKERGSTL